MSDATFTGTITWARPYRYDSSLGTLVVLAHPGARVQVLLPEGTDPALTRPETRITVTGDDSTDVMYADTVKAA